MKHVFTDITALEAMIWENHPNHISAKQIVKISSARNYHLVTTHHSVISLADSLKQKGHNNCAAKIASAIQNSRLISIEPSISEDDQEAWRLFNEFDDPWWSFSRCMSIAIMNRMDIQTVFGFDINFTRYGFKIIPEGQKA